MSVGRGRGGERGSVLVLVPAGFLVLVLLAALAVDSSVSYRDQSELHDVLSAAANDAASAGLSDQSFYGGSGVRLSPQAAAAAVCQSVQAQEVGSSLHHIQLTLAVSADSLRVTGSATIDAVFGRAVPHIGTHTVKSSADATLSAGGPAGAADYGPASSITCPG